MYAHFDRNTFPLIIIRFTGEKETPENFAAYLAGLYANYERKEAFALVFDATQAPTPNPVYQQKQAKWMKEHEALIKTYCRGVAYVMPNGLLRGVLKMIFSLQKNPVPFKVMSNLEEGRKWARSLV
ncbi:MAG: STAS/SEC14 domain-containing protein [Bacteroidota bacterium]